MQPDNRLLTNLIKCEKEHHSALLSLLVRSHTSLAALSAYASAAAPPVAQALLGCIQAFAAADEGLRGYAAAVEGWKEELKEVKRVEDEYKAVVRDKEILVGRLIKASKQKIPTSSLQAGPAPIPNASYLAQSSPSSSSFSLPTSQPYHFTPTPHATQHINSKLALAQRELHACEAHLSSKEAELAEVRRSAMTEGMARRCRAMADVGVVWRERGEQGMGALDALGRDAAGTAPPQQPYYTPPRRSMSSHSGSSIAPSHSASQQRPRSQSPFYAPPRAQSPGTYQTLAGGYQHSHPLPALPERDSWHGESSYHPDPQLHAESSRRPMSMVDPPRPISLIGPPRAPRPTVDPRRPISSHDLPAPPEEEVLLDIPPPHSIGDGGEFIPVGRPVSSSGHEGWTMRENGWSSSEDEDNYKVVENDRTARWEPTPDVDEEILRAVEKMGVVVPPKPQVQVQPRNSPPTPPETASPCLSPVGLPDVRIIEATPQKTTKKLGQGKKTKRRQGGLLTQRGAAVGVEETVRPTGTTSAPAPRPVDKVVSRVASPAPVPASRAASPSPVPAMVARPAPPSRSPSPRPVDSPALVPTSTSTAHTPEPGALPTSESVTSAIHTSTLLNPDDSRSYRAVPPVSTDDEEDDEDEDGYATTTDPVDPTASTEPPRATRSDDVIHQPGDTHEDPARIGNPAAVLSLATIDSFAAASSPVPLVSAEPVKSVGAAATPVPTTLEPAKSTLASDPVLSTSATAIGLMTPMATGTSSVTAIAPKTRIVSSSSEPLVNRTRTKSISKRTTAESRRATADSEGETTGRKKSKRKGHSRQSSMVDPGTRPTKGRQASAEDRADDRADLAALLRDSNAPSPHVHFPAPGGVYVPSAPAPPRQPGLLYLPSTGGTGTTRSDIGPAQSHHFEVPPSPVASSGRGRSGSGSVSFFGRVAGLFGRKKPAGDGYLSSGGGGGGGQGQAWRTRTDGNLARSRGDDSSDDEPGNLVAVTNVGPRMVAVDNNPATGSPSRGALGRKLTKADRGQTLRVGPPPESPSRTRKPSLTEERIVPAGKPKGRRTKGHSVDGGNLSRRGSLKSNTSEPVARASLDVGSKHPKEPASLMAIVEGPGLVLPSQFVSRRTDSPRRADSPARSQTLAVPPTRVVSPTTTAAPKPIRATSPMPLKSALRNSTPSPLPPAAPSPRVLSPTAGLAVPSPNIPAQSPRNSIAESFYETGEEDFDDASDGESDMTASGPAQDPQSPGTALAAFKDGLGVSISNTAGSVSTAGPFSATSARKSVRINPDPPEMSATPAATPGEELEEEESWTPGRRSAEKPAPSSVGGWQSRIGRGWEDSSDESDEEYERVRRALESSSKHMEAVNGVGVGGKGKARR